MVRVCNPGTGRLAGMPVYKVVGRVVHLGYVNCGRHNFALLLLF
jgi:hypothetical protein